MNENKKVGVMIGGTIGVILFALLIKLGIVIFIIWIIVKVLQHMGII